MPSTYDWRDDVRARLADAKLRPEDEAELVEEIAQHLEEQFAELSSRVGPNAAREQLLAQLRDDAFEEAIAGKRRRERPSRSRVWTSGSLMRDIRHGFRSLRRSPATFIAGSAALALGIGLTATMFSVIYGLLIKGLPYDDPSRIAIIKFIDPAHPGVDALVTFGDFAQYRTKQRSFETLAAYTTSTVNVSGGDRPDRVAAASVTPGVLEATRVRPALGRVFDAADAVPSADPAVILSHTVWRDRFAANPKVIGATLRVDGAPHTIVGVMPAGYDFPATTRVWLPLQTNSIASAPGSGPLVYVVGRLRPDASYDNANAELGGLADRFRVLHVPDGSKMHLVVLPFVRASVNPRIYGLLDVMLGAVLLVLLVACANVANLLLDRAVNRTREIGIRTALGASRLAVMRQSIVESGILAIVAALAGVAIAWFGVTAFNRAVAGVTIPVFWMDIRLHPPVLVFVVVIAVAASLVAGALPAIQSARLDVAAILKDESHAASSLRVGRLSRAIVVVQIAISSAILLASGFMTRSIVNLSHVDPGFTTNRIVTARVTLTSNDSIKQRAFFEQLQRDLATLPGGDAAYIGNGLPGTGWLTRPLTVDGRTYRHDRDHPLIRSLAVNPGFFSTFGLHAVRGRLITASDRAGTENVAVVSESFVRRHFGRGDAIGKRIRVGVDSAAPWLTIVGVTPTLFSQTIEDPWPAEVLTSFWQQAHLSTAAFALRGDAGTTAALQKIVASIDPDTPIYATLSMDEVMSQPMLYFQVFATMFLVFGITALILSSIGLYAVMAFSVSRRVRELGVRLALGATPGAVLRMIVRQGARQIVIGMTIGFLAGTALVRVARAVLFQVRPGDPFVMLLVAVVLGGTAAIACLVPARRATRVDPVIALRTD